MPMIVDMLKNSIIDINDIDSIAVAVGPGSFTGLRIGISAVKGIAAPKGIKCIPVSTLRAMAQSFKGQDCIVCAVMDARCNQVYNALFDISADKITRICEDRALLCDELASEIESISKDKLIIICGDGADLFYPYVKHLNAKLAQQPLLYQNAIGVGLCAFEGGQEFDVVPPEMLLPVYLRLPQAERELKAKQKNSEMGI